MDAPGFPSGPASPVPVLVAWIVLVALVALAGATAVRVLRRGRGGTGWRVLVVVAVIAAIVPLLVLALPARAHVGTDTVDGRAECPLSTVAGSFMAGDPGSDLHRFWKPCQDASRVRAGLSLGGYAALAGVIGLLALARTDDRASTPRQSERNLTG